MSDHTEQAGRTDGTRFTAEALRTSDQRVPGKTGGSPPRARPSPSKGEPSPGMRSSRKRPASHEPAARARTEPREEGSSAKEHRQSEGSRGSQADQKPVRPQPSGPHFCNVYLQQEDWNFLLVRHLVAHELRSASGPKDLPKLFQKLLPPGRYLVDVFDRFGALLWRDGLTVGPQLKPPPMAEDLVSRLLEDRVRHREGPIRADDLPKLRAIVDENRRVLSRLDREHALDLIGHFWRQLEQERAQAEVPVAGADHELKETGEASVETPCEDGPVDPVSTSPVDYFDLLDDLSEGFSGPDPMDLLPRSRWSRSLWRNNGA